MRLTAVAIGLLLAAAPMPASAASDRRGSNTPVLCVRSPTEAASAPVESPGDRAARHFAAEEWDEAIDALVEAYALDPDPDYLYARAQAERFRGRCDVAIAMYEHFLASDPAPQQRQDTERNIELCRAQLAPIPPPARVEAPTDDPTAPTNPPDEPPPRRRAGADVAAIVLVSVGAVAVATGASLWIIGARTRDRAPRESDEDGYATALRRGRALTIAGITVTSVGVAAGVGAAIRFGLLARRDRAGRRVAFALPARQSK
jgi:tetratricopeptide (TPR) repeat protein